MVDALKCPAAARIQRLGSTDGGPRSALVESDMLEAMSLERRCLNGELPEHRQPWESGIQLYGQSLRDLLEGRKVLE